jgi:hypothetical protein
MRYLILITLIAVIAGSAMADDVVTMPTANQLKKGEVDLAAYYLALDNPSALPQNINYQTVYVGLTDNLEIDAHRADVDKDETATVLVATYKLLSETSTTPDLVVGCRNLAGTATTLVPALRDKSKDRSYFIAGAKTLFLNPTQPGPPLVRLHLGLGTPDWTMFNDRRHDGVFGGAQMLVKPDLGFVLQYDGENVITGIAFSPKNSGLTIKGGTFGEHTWVGVAYRKMLSY